MKSFLQAVASQCFITGLMQRLLFLQLWDHLPPLYLVLFPHLPHCLPFPVMSQEAPMAAYITLFPRHLVGYRLCSSQTFAREGWVLVRAEISAPRHVIALPKSHSEFKGSSLEDCGTYLLLEEADLHSRWPRCLRRMCIKKKLVFNDL